MYRLPPHASALNQFERQQTSPTVTCWADSATHSKPSTRSADCALNLAKSDPCRTSYRAAASLEAVYHSDAAV